MSQDKKEASWPRRSRLIRSWTNSYRSANDAASSFNHPKSTAGLGSCWDYGPLGVELKNNIKRFWWEAMTHRRDDIEGLDAAILMAPQVWVTSGHVEGFTDPLVDCKKCKMRFRADQIELPRSAPTAAAS